MYYKSLVNILSKHDADTASYTGQSDIENDKGETSIIIISVDITKHIILSLARHTLVPAENFKRLIVIKTNSDWKLPKVFIL